MGRGFFPTTIGYSAAAYAPTQKTSLTKQAETYVPECTDHNTYDLEAGGVVDAGGQLSCSVVIVTMKQVFFSFYLVCQSKQRENIYYSCSLLALLGGDILPIRLLLCARGAGQTDCISVFLDEVRHLGFIPGGDRRGEMIRVGGRCTNRGRNNLRMHGDRSH